MSEPQLTAIDIRRIVREELTTVSAPQPSVASLMHAILALHPGAIVKAELHGPEVWADVTVTRLPGIFKTEVRDDAYPNCLHTVGGDYINVARYGDDDLVAALQTALKVITEHSAVAA